jgi:hypothetical protein
VLQRPFGSRSATGHRASRGRASTAAGAAVVLAGVGAHLPDGVVQYALWAVGGVLGVAAVVVPEKK